MSKPTLHTAVPILASLDITTTVQFYTENLGFTCRFESQGEYAILQRDSIEIHFWPCDTDATSQPIPHVASVSPASPRFTRNIRHEESFAPTASCMIPLGIRASLRCSTHTAIWLLFLRGGPMLPPEKLPLEVIGIE